MKESSLTAGFLLLLASFAMNLILIVRDGHMSKTIERQQDRLGAYSEYYDATERMLDRIDENKVNATLEGDAGEKYLDKKSILDSLLYN